VLGTEAISVDGTVSGTYDQFIITAVGELVIVKKSFVSTDETHEIGTTTGVSHVLGTTTVIGTYTNDVAGTVTIAVLGTPAIYVVGTFVGTTLNETIANDGDEAITMTSVVFNVET
jgi:hypothetical protein